MKKEKLYTTIRIMKQGDQCRFPLSKLTYVRVSATNLGIELNRKYSTHIDRESNTIICTRER